MLDVIDKSAFLKLFVRNGYVLNFSTNDFDIFTTESIGVPLCKQYNLSKGKSLSAYCNDADNNQVVKLFSDLLRYYEIHCMHLSYEAENKTLYEKCKEILEREKGVVLVSTPAIVCVNRDYIVDVAERANRDVDNGEYDSAITKSRTLLEEVFCYTIEAKGEIPNNSGDINSLYKQVKELYNMHNGKDVDTRINMLLSGLEKILTAIAQMRNASSDSHGVGCRRIKINEHHARLFVNSALTMADFILSVEKNANNSDE